jgi:hypothetical protein
MALRSGAKNRVGNVTVDRVNLRREPIRVDSLDEVVADDSWSYTDLAGHTHQWVPWTETTKRVPTLKRVVTGSHWCELCHDEHEDSHLECVACGEWIVPAVEHLGPTTSWLAGMLEVDVDVTIEHAPGVTESKRIVPRTLEEAEAVAALFEVAMRRNEPPSGLVAYLRENGLLS